MFYNMSYDGEKKVHLTRQPLQHSIRFWRQFWAHVFPLLLQSLSKCSLRTVAATSGAHSHSLFD